MQDLLDLLLDLLHVDDVGLFGLLFEWLSCRLESLCGCTEAEVVQCWRMFNGCGWSALYSYVSLLLNIRHTEIHQQTCLRAVATVKLL